MEIHLCQNCTHNRIYSTLMSLSEAPPCAFCVSWRRRSYWSPWCPPSDSVWSTDTPTSDAMPCWPSTLYTGTNPAQHNVHSPAQQNVLSIYCIYRYKDNTAQCANLVHCTQGENQLSTLLVIFNVYRSDFSAMHTLYANVNEWYISAEKSVTLRS